MAAGAARGHVGSAGVNRLGRIGLGATAMSTATLGYAIGVERNRWRLREATVAVLAPGQAPLRVLHISDVHMMPGQRAKQRFVAALADLGPDLVVNTGDTLSHGDSVPAVCTALGGLLDVPGEFVFGSNDYYSPQPSNPARYLSRRGRRERTYGAELPWPDLRAALVEHGWADVTHRRMRMRLDDRAVFVAGVDDPHLGRDRYTRIAGGADASAAASLGVTHSPEPRVLDAFAEDGYDLVLAGHTHGGQLRIPGYGALVTNCGLDRSRARGLSRWGARTWLHVSAGIGTSPYAPIRFGCRPESTLLTLVARPPGGSDARQPVDPAQGRTPATVS
jgi:predicted MPP superfamily phosphohydrolase